MTSDTPETPVVEPVVVDDPEIAAAIVRRRERLEGASRDRNDAQAARELKMATFRRQAEETIEPQLRSVVDQITRELGISAEVVDDLQNASPWIALKMRVPPRTSEVRFSFSLEDNVVTTRATGDGENGGPRMDRRDVADVTSEFVHQQARDAFVNATT
jgi:hypothetical protein